MLRLEQRALNGDLAFVIEVTAIDVNTAIPPERFASVQPAGSSLDDHRPDVFSNPIGVPGPAPQPLADVRAAATFAVRTPAYLPAGFELRSVEHFQFDPASQYS